MAVARAARKLRGRKPKLSPRQEAHLVELSRDGSKSPAEVAELFSVATGYLNALAYARTACRART